MSEWFAALIGLLLLQTPQSIRGLEPRIIGGYAADITNLPYIVSIQLYGSHYCGGSIVNRRTILTAAHCLGGGITHNLLSVKVGGVKRAKDGHIYSVAAIHSHEKFSSKTMDYDLAIVRLAKNLTYSHKVRAIPLSRKEVPAGTFATISGWGYTSQKASPSDRLRYARVPIINQTECRNVMGKNLITDRMICAGYTEGGVDACQMDSGGPLAVREKLHGIVSWGVGCAQANKPGVYTRIPVLLPWLEKQMKKLYGEVI
ncbi:uncharacterized protein Dwil_GK22079 [Drosophila willistoni]|uniref:Peptidase S1 domain-containing protein n=1 Tax=Drosophila willistoni TaxID=7260 RepID=B4MYH0_DROWI|nr:trypsin-7 [Drosophila willistoni]EDW77159.1 uncharacterized protein Dwil_GK22079 [Drosophila willistoni]